MEKYTKYICYIFGDDPDVIRLITSFTSTKHFDRNTRPFDTPLTLESGCLFGFDRRSHRVENLLERSVFEVLKRLKKHDFYDAFVEQLRDYHDNIRYVISVSERVAEMRVGANEMEAFVSDVQKDFQQLIKRFIYYYFVNLDEETVKSWFNVVRRTYDQYENEVLLTLKNLRDAAADCCVEDDSPAKKRKM